MDSRNCYYYCNTFCQILEFPSKFLSYLPKGGGEKMSYVITGLFTETEHIYSLDSDFMLK